jgi:hypothetical protein
MASAVDLPNNLDSGAPAGGVHLMDKRTIGQRLALGARALVYNQQWRRAIHNLSTSKLGTSTSNGRNGDSRGSDDDPSSGMDSELVVYEGPQFTHATVLDAASSTTRTRSSASSPTGSDRAATPTNPWRYRWWHTCGGALHQHCPLGYTGAYCYSVLIPSILIPSVLIPSVFIRPPLKSTALSSILRVVGVAVGSRPQW